MTTTEDLESKETVQESTTFPLAIKSRIHKDYQDRDLSGKRDTLGGIQDYILNKVAEEMEFNPIKISLLPRKPQLDFDKIMEGNGGIENEATATPILGGDRVAVVIDPVQLIGLVGRDQNGALGLSRDKFNQLVKAWEKLKREGRTKVDLQTGLKIAEKKYPRPYINIILAFNVEGKKEEIRVPAYLADPKNPDDIPDINSLGITQGFIDTVKSKTGWDLYEQGREALITGFSIPRTPSHIDTYIQEE